MNSTKFGTSLITIIIYDEFFVAVFRIFLIDRRNIPFTIGKEVVQNTDRKKFKALIKYHENENKNSITHSKQLFIGNMLYVSPESA